MILSDGSIADAIEAGEIGVDPDVRGNQIQPGSLDVRFGGNLYDAHLDMVEGAPVGETLELRPWTFYIGHTRDEVSLPNDISAQLTGRSTFGRKGVVVHMTAGWIDPGFEGQITLEMFNFGMKPIEIEVGQRVAQLVFFRMDEESSGYDGRYQGQDGITTDRD